MTRSRLQLGAAGEELAARWYRRQGYEVLARNWRCREGELDLVLRSPQGELVFAEVKTRRSARFGLPAEAVTADKQRRIRGLAMQFMRQESRSGKGIRFDVVSILDGRIQVLEAAF